MNYLGVEICCPACQGDLSLRQPEENSFICGACNRRYPILLGIPDFRIYPDPYLSNDEDWAKASELAAYFDHSDFAGLVSHYYRDKQDVPSNMIRQYTAGLMAGEARAASVLQNWEAMAQRSVFTKSAQVLEIGCGTAPLLVAAGEIGCHLVGVDIGLRWLVIGKRRLADAHLDIPLFCASAEALPFPADAYEVVVNESTLENLHDQKLALQEMCRIIPQGGYLCLSTANKYSLGPDPHTGILAGGYLPESWMTKIVQRQGGIPPRRRLLSASKLSQIINQACFTSPVLALPDIPKAQRNQFGRGLQFAVSVYHIVKSLPGFSGLLRLIGPTLLAVAQKTEGISQRSIQNQHPQFQSQVHE